MASTITYDHLWNTYQKEKQSNQLQPLAKTFYADSHAFIDKLGTADATTKTNSTNLLNDLFEKRRQKILVYAAYAKPLPQSVDASEQDFYDRLLALMKNSRPGGASIKSTNKVTLKVIKDIPEVILPSGGRAGPFRSNQTIELDSKEVADIDFLLSNAICERP